MLGKLEYNNIQALNFATERKTLSAVWSENNEIGLTVASIDPVNDYNRIDQLVNQMYEIYNAELDLMQL